MRKQSLLGERDAAHMIIQPSIMSRSYETLLDLAGVWDMNYHELKKVDDPDLMQRCKSDPDNIETFQDFARAGCGNICEGLKQVLDSDSIFLRPDQRKFLFGIIEDLTMMRNLPMDGWVTVIRQAADVLNAEGSAVNSKRSRKLSRYADDIIGGHISEQNMWFCVAVQAYFVRATSHLWTETDEANQIVDRTVKEIWLNIMKPMIIDEISSRAEAQIAACAR